MKALALNTVLRRVQQLPPLPEVVLDILQTTSAENGDAAQLARKIARDQAVAARVLRVANSPFYGMQGRIGSIQEAVVVLGFHNVRSLISAASIINRFQVEGFDHLRFWRHSLAVGVCARVLARRGAENGEIAFTAGLLHDIGRLILAAGFAEELRAVYAHRAREDCTMVDAERAVLGLDHAAVGAEAAQCWRLPAAMRLAIAHHHQPEAGEPLADLVHVANVVCHALDLGNAQDDPVPPLSAAAWQRLGLSWQDMKIWLPEIEAQFDDMSLLLAGSREYGASHGVR